MDLSTLVKMSNTYGSNPAYVLAGGGNTSVKDDTTLYVKGSGTQLATIKAEEFVEMSRARLNEIMKTDYPEDDVKRESLYLADVMAAVTDADKTKRPSVEALLHNLFAYTYVLHVHPTLVNGLTCGKGAKELSEQLLGKDVLWIDICKPGYTLARICYEKMNAYFGAEAILPVYIELDDGVRLQRALDRELRQEKPKYEEMCRRFLADSADFSEEKLAAAGIRDRFENTDLTKCLKDITKYLKEAGI